MTSFPIMLQSISDIKEFVNAASHLDCEVDVRSGRYLVDGKSIMGLFSIDLSEPVAAEVHGTDAQGEMFRQAMAHFVSEKE